MAELGTLDYDHTLFSRPRAGDERLAVRFFRKAKQDPDKTAVEGRPIFVEHDYIQVMVPGDRDSAHVRPIRPGDLIRFKAQYEHWKTTQNNEAVTGTPIDVLGLSLAQVEEYRYFGVRTVEQMAELRDDICQKLMGATSLKQKAIAYLQIIKDEAPLRRVQVELDKRDSQIEALTKAVESQAEMIKQLQAGLSPIA